MLHITSSLSVAERLNNASLSGTPLGYGDPLSEGPVPRGRLAALRETRARFADDSGWEPFERALERYTTRDAAFDEASGYGEEIVLWFGTNLIDQLALVEILQRLAVTANLASQVPDDQSLDTLTPAQLTQLFRLRQPTTGAQIKEAVNVWSAYVAPEPSRLLAIAAVHVSPLPHLPDAIRRHLAEFPSTSNGLSLTENTLLSVLADSDGPMVAADIVRQARQVDDMQFMSDQVLSSILRRLRKANVPAVAYQGVDKPLSLTESGRALLDNKADWVALNGVDVWRGGVHLKGNDIRWRWDSEAGSLVSDEDS